jgi:ribonuclease G
VSRELLIAVSPGEIWAALVEEEALAALRVLRPDAPGAVGDVFLGRILALKPELPAALVDIGLDRPAFLSAEDAAKGTGIAGLHQGQAVIVQIVKEARADKAAGVSMRLRLAGQFLELRPARPGIAAARGLDADERDRLTAALGGMARPEEGFFLRAAAAGAPLEALRADVAALRARHRSIEQASRAQPAPALLEGASSPLMLLLEEMATAGLDAVAVDDRAAYAEARQWLARRHPALADRLELHRGAEPLFEHRGVAGEIAAVLAPRLALAGGGALTIEITAAATMIDVDSASAAGGQPESAALAVNLAAARAVARQIRLRNLAGPIVVDFVGMRRRGDRERVRAALAAALAGDDDSEVLGWTRLGHLELVRKRRHAPLPELLFERMPGGGWIKKPLTVALEALRALAHEAAARPLRNPALHVHPEVAAAFDGPARAARRELEARLGQTLTLVAEPGRTRDTFDIRRD